MAPSREGPRMSSGNIRDQAELADLLQRVSNLALTLLEVKPPTRT